MTTDASLGRRGRALVVVGVLVLALLATWWLGMWDSATPEERAAQASSSGSGNFASGLTR